MKRRSGIGEYRDYRAPLFFSAYSPEIRERIRKHLEERGRTYSDWQEEWRQPFRFQSSAARQTGSAQRVRIRELLDSPDVAVEPDGAPPSGSLMNARRWAERIFLVLGLAGLSIWLGSIAVTKLYQTWDSHEFDRELHQKLAEGKPGSAPKLPAEIPEGGLIGRLSIPRLQLTEIVRQGDSAGTLRLTLGHIPGTALPGQEGNVAVAGHRDTLFRGLRNIHKNDLIVFETSSGKYEYQVESTTIVRPEDVSVLNASDHPELTLVTCYPFFYVGPAPKRFIVKARQVAGTAPTLQARGL